ASHHARGKRFCCDRAGVAVARSDFTRAQFSVDYTINMVGLELRQGQGASAKDKSFSRGCDISGVWLVMLRRLPLVQRRLAIVCRLILSLSIRMVWPRPI